MLLPVNVDVFVPRTKYHSLQKVQMYNVSNWGSQPSSIAQHLYVISFNNATVQPYMNNEIARVCRFPMIVSNELLWPWKDVEDIASFK
mmetsp:Transcript_21234/g.25709  ORF Transcript_21234/g.25709 Transcript_21234/m.25709 type:complete len:88 (-) Transcript_21234:110-373(-)